VKNNVGSIVRVIVGVIAKLGGFRALCEQLQYLLMSHH